MRMTEDGRQLFDRAAPLLADLVAAGAEVSARDGQVRGHLRVSVPALLARSGMGAFAATFVKKYPAVKLEIDIVIPPFGLGGSVFTSDPQHGAEVAKKISTGEKASADCGPLRFVSLMPSDLVVRPP